jgi:hypothetical protein
MNAMLLLVAILFALIAVAGYNIVTMSQAFNISASIQQNHARVQVVTSAIRTGLTVIDGKVAVPVSAALTADVPDLAPFRTAANGIPYVYCPVLPAAASGASLLVNGGANESYAVDTSERNGITYAVAGRPGGLHDARISSLGIVAYILTSQPNNSDPLRCADVTVAEDGTTLLVRGGSVSPIFDNPVAADGASFVLSPDGVRPPTAATSDRVARSVTEIIDYVGHYDVNDVRIRVFGGETFKADELSDLFRMTDGRTVRLEGPSGAMAVINIETQDDGGLVELRPRGRAIFSNVSLKAAGADVAVAAAPGGSVVLDGAMIGRIRSNGGDIVLAGASRVVPASSAEAMALPVIADGGRVVIDVDDSSSSPAILAQESAALFEAVGGDIVVKSDIHASAGASTELFRTTRGGMLRMASPEAELLVDRGDGFAVEEHVELQRVSASCADGDPSCTASCPPSKRVAWGECSSSNGAALSGFAVDGTGSSYTCQWAQMTLAIAPKAAAVCQSR